MRMPSLLPLQLLPVNEERVAHSRARGGVVTAAARPQWLRRVHKRDVSGNVCGNFGAWLSKCLSCLIKVFNHVASKLIVFFFKN